MAMVRANGCLKPSQGRRKVAQAMTQGWRKARPEVHCARLRVKSETGNTQNEPRLHKSQSFDMLSHSGSLSRTRSARFEQTPFSGHSSECVWRHHNHSWLGPWHCARAKRLWTLSKQTPGTLKGLSEGTKMCPSNMSPLSFKRFKCVLGIFALGI